MTLFMPWAANAQSVQIGDGTATSGYLPTYSFYNYSVTQQIYTADEIAASGTITSIAFFNGGTTKARQLSIYMMHTTKNVFESTTDWVAVTDANLVYAASAAQDITAGEWTTFTLDTPFAYNGTDNLLIAVTDLTGSYSSGMACRSFTTATNQAIYKYQDAGAYGPDGTYNGTAQTGNLALFKNQIILGGIQQAYPNPTNLVVTPYPTSAKLEWTENGNATSWEVAYKLAADENFTTMTVNTNPYTITGLTGETAYNAKVRAYYSATVQSGWSSVVNFSTLVACPAPTALTASNLTTTSATLSWTPGYEETSWVLQYGTNNAFGDGTYTEVNVSGTPSKDLTGLTEATTYYARVKANCGGGDESAWSSVLTFATKETCPDGLICIGEGVSTNSSLPANNYYNYSLSQQIYTADEIGEAGAILSIDFFKASDVEMVKNLDIYMVNTTKSAFTSNTDWITVTAADLVFTGNVTFDYNAWTTIELDTPFNYDGTSNLAIIVDNNTGSYKSSTNFLVFSTGTTYQAIYYQSDGTNADPTNLNIQGSITNTKNRIRLAIGEPPACPKPAGLTVNYEGDLTAEVTWLGDANSYDIDVNGTVTTGVTSPYTLDNLALSTDYEVKVRANCGSDGYSEWAGPVTFTTDDCMSSEMTTVNYTLTDSYGDGWNGNYILVVDGSCNIVESLTIASGSTLQGTFKVCGSYVQFLWYAGSYPGETSWEFTDADGNVLFSGTGSTDMATYDAIYTIDSSPYPTPSDITVSDVGPYGATIGWTENGTATAWEIMLNQDETNIIPADSNPFTVTGLDPETEYFVQVRATGSAGTSMWPCVGNSFTTLEGCSAPELTVTPYPFSADVDWFDWEGSYDLDWCQAPTSKDGGIWMQYENGTLTANIGASTSSEQTWGVMYPNAMLQGNKSLTKVAFYVNPTYHTNDFTINIYQGDDPISGTLLGTQTATPATTAGMMEVELTSPITINPSQNLWITLTTTGTYVKTGANVSDPNAQWVLSNGEWVSIASLNSDLAAYGWMIRGYVEGYNALDFDWTSETGVTPPYTIDGLDPETQYVVRVKASCGDAWTWYYFTTPSACDAPINLETNDVTDNSAMLSWTGYQDRFVLRYRTTDDTTDPNAPATIILEAHDAWGDGTGYQMLLDADATAYGNEIPETGPYTGSDYTAFEYLIPENADCDSNTENIVFDGSVTLEIPAGVYDWCIVNPEPGGNMWIAGNGEIPSRNDDFMFEPGVTYHFTMQTGFGTGDGAVYEVIRPMADWIEEDIAGETEFELTGLNQMTYYEWQVRGENDECTGGEEDGYTEWSELVSFMTTAPQGQTIELAAGWNWVSFYKEITMADLQAAIVAANPGAQPVIKSQADGQTTYNGAIWLGALRNLDLTQMYEIKVANACTITLNGDAIDAANFEITIKPGINWIAYPLNTTMAVADAFAGFSTKFDVVKSRNDGQANFMGAIWTGALKDLVPGQGYIYNSKATASQPFTYPTPTSRSASKAAVTTDPAFNRTIPCIDMYK